MLNQKRITIIDRDKILTEINQRWEKLANTQNPQLYRHFRRLWEYIRRNEVCNEIIESLLRQYPTAETDSFLIENGNWTYFDDERRDIAASIKLMDQLTSPNHDYNSLFQIGSTYVQSRAKSIFYYIGQFYELFLLPVLNYITDNIESGTLIITTLKKFKHRCEWFEKPSLIQAYINDTKNGEKNLQSELYKFLFDQGIPLIMESQSPSGKIDFISSQVGNEKVYAEVKIFHPEKSKDKNYIIKGVHQLISYLNDYNEHVGYLVIFKTGRENLSFDDFPISHYLPCVEINKKIVYILTVDIFEYEKPASKRGKTKTVIITTNDLK